MCFRRGPAFLLTLFVVGATVHEPSLPQDGPPPHSEVREQVLVRRAHWPVLIEPLPGRADPGLCSSLRPEQVELLEDGVPARVTALGPRPLPRLHALLVDTSRSMLDSGLLDAAKRAATEYVDTLPGDEPAMLASFDVSLLLGAPATTDRETLRAAIDRLGTVSDGTALWDALYYLSVYLGALPVEKVLVVLTDGVDVGSLPENTSGRVSELVGATPNLTVFAIRLFRRAERGGATTRATLGGLARRSGGELFELEEASQLGRTYRRIRERMDERRYVSYVPLPFGEGPKDGRSGTGYRWREVKVRAAEGAPCKVTPLRSSRRFAALPGTPVPGRQAPAYFQPAGPGEEIPGRARDLLVATGPLYEPRRLRNAGKLQATLNRAPLHSMRHVSLVVPDADLVRSELTGPAELLLYMLRQGLPAPAAMVAEPAARPPFLVDGYSFLEMREVIGRALLESRPGWRRWADERLAVRVEAELQSLITRAPQVERLGEEELGLLRAAMLSSASSPEEGSAHLLVSEWLGDVSAREAALELERAAVDRVLRDAAGQGSASELVRTVERGWHKLPRWFPPGVASRVLTPLVPAYDPVGDRIGFYRFVLAWPRSFDDRPRNVPVRPLALAAARWIAGRPEAAALLAGVSRSVSIDYAAADRKTLRELRCPAAPPDFEADSRGADLPERVVVLELEGTPPAGGRVRLRTRFDGDEAALLEPVCIEVRPAAGEVEADRARSAALAAALGSTGRLVTEGAP